MIRTWLRPRCRRHSRPTRHPAVSRPTVELLEDRRLLNAGSLDPFFGFLGKSVTPLLSSASDTASATAFQADGKLIVGGTSAYGTAQDAQESAFALARYNANGTLDWGFGLGGRTTAFFGPNLAGVGAFNFAQVNAIAVQPDGKILAAGVQSSGSPTFALARFNANGTLDQTFGTGGEELTFFPSQASATTSTATGIALLPGGGFVVAGQAGFGAASTFALARYTANGGLDTTFNGTGKVMTQVTPGTIEGANAVTVQPAGNSFNIVVAGFTQTSAKVSAPFEFAVVRYTPTGSLDTFFNHTGVVTTPFSVAGNAVSEFADGVTVLSGGQLRVAGDSAHAHATPVVAQAQYNADGSLDTTFGSGGTVTAPFANTFAQAGAGLSLTPDGKLVVAGSTGGASSDFAVERYNADGTVDTSFGTGGTVTTDFGGTDAATAVAVKADGTLAVAGDTNSNLGDFAVARYRGNGSLLSSFGGGKVTTNFFFSTVAPTSPLLGLAPSSGFIAALPNGDLLVAGTIAPDGLDGEFVLARYTSFGLPDLTFGNFGTVVTNFGSSATVSGIAVGPDGKIALVGSAVNPSTGVGDIAVARYKPDGSPDTNFNGTGTLFVDFNGQNSTGSGVAVEPNGEIVVVGTTTAANQDFALALIEANGTLDPNFGTNGEVITDFGGAQAAGVVLLTSGPNSGDILVGGTAFSVGQMAVARYLPNGALDGGFGSGGLATANFVAGSTGSSLAVAPSGAIVVGGTTANPADPTGQEQNFALAQFSAGGTLDPSFGSGGEMSFSFNGGGIDTAASVAIQADGKILIAGTATNATTFKSDFALARVTTAGTLDSTFGTGGEVTTDFGGTDVAASVVLTPTGNIVVGGAVFGNGGGYLALACYLGDRGDPFNF